MSETQTCPRCGLGKDTNGDGDCPVCARVPEDALPVPIWKLVPKR